MWRKIRALIALVRPMQVYKVGIVWLPALFHGHGNLRTQAGMLALVSLAWWLTSSIVYIFNDLKDAPSDRLRPERAHRPLASGALAPWEALLLAAALLVALLGCLQFLPGRVALLFGLYAAFNLVYTLGLKESLGPRQAIIAIGFWLRLQSGATPVVPIPLTPWASLFTIGLAYYLNSLKGLAAYDHERHRGYRFAMGMGAGLAGSLALASLVAICLKRGVDGTMAFPELPPLLCLVGMQRVAFASFEKSHGKEQSRGFFFDPVTVLAMVCFAAFFIYA
jgi:4-hydroxybenzoate polyprenyltransferase